MDSLLFSLNAVLPVFLIILAGYFFARYKILDTDFSDTASRFVFIAALPALLFKNVAGSDFSGIFNRDLLNSVLLVVAATVLIFSSLIFFTKKRFVDEKRRGAFIQGSFRGNFALLGIPLIYNIASDEGVLAASLIAAFVIPLYNILAIIALSLHRKTGIKLMVITMIKNPLIIATVAGMMVSAANIELPVIFNRTVDMLAVLAIPMALLSIGVFFKLDNFFSNIKTVTLTAVIKTVITPLIFAPAAYLAGLRGVYLASVFVLFAAPSAVSCYIMAKGMGADEELTAGIIILSTAISSLTLFVGIYILRNLGLI